MPRECGEARFVLVLFLMWPLLGACSIYIEECGNMPCRRGLVPSPHGRIAKENTREYQSETDRLPLPH